MLRAQAVRCAESAIPFRPDSKSESLRVYGWRWREGRPVQVTVEVSRPWRPRHTLSS